MMTLTSTNQQLKEGISLHPDGWLDVQSTFKTIQGEGPFTGVPAIFVRLAGCNFQCPGCDTDYTSTRRVMSPGAIMEDALEKTVGTAINLLVLTGGEPFRQDIAKFIHMASLVFHVQIETNGSLYQPIGICPITGRLANSNISIICSPKSPKIHPELAHKVSSYKYVLQHGRISKKDGLPTNSILGEDSPPAYRPIGLAKTSIYVQPLDEGDPDKNNKNVQACIDSCTKFGYRLSIQTHKIIGLE